MSVNHLKMHAKQAKAAGGYADSRNIRTSEHPAPASAANSPAPVGAVKAYSNEAVRASRGPRQPEHGGARAGAKSGQPNIGTRLKNVYPTSGGKLN